MSSALRVLIVGAHPDDCEVHFAGMAALYAEQGHEVLMMSVTDGRCGHYSMKPAALARRRREEARRAAAAVGARSKVLPFHDTELVPDLKTRKIFLAEVRKFAPDLMLIHQMEDYHPDHRATVQLTYDISYLVTVPLVCPQVNAMKLKSTPVIMHSARGRNTAGMPERIIGVPVDKVWRKKFAAMHEHTSQFYEWLPWEQGRLEEVPGSRAARLKYLEDWRGPTYEAVADWCKTKANLKGRRRKDFRYAEAVYPARAGRALTKELIERVFPFEKLVIGF